MIVGGGVSGVAVAIHLLRRGGRTLHIVLVEKGSQVGRGIAFGVSSPVFRLNVPASKMSLDPQRPDDFMAWAGADASAFLPRATFARYVAVRFDEARRGSLATLQIVRGEAVALDGRSVRLSDGVDLPADTVVLATGIEPRIGPSPLPADARIIDAWDEGALASLPLAGRLMVLGSGLSALDVVALLDAQGFEGSVTVLSRRGLLPRAHLSPLRSSVPLPRDQVDAAPATLAGLLRWCRSIVREHQARGLPWQLGIEALRPHVMHLYRSLPPAHRARFVRSVRPFWDVLRHRAPPDALDLVEALRQQGRLEILAGRIASCQLLPDAIELGLALANAPPRGIRVDRIVRCIGPALDRSEADAPLDRALVASGLAAADPAGLGIVTDELGRVVDPSGEASERLLAIGAVLRASSWESTAVPDISVHALALAKRIVP